MNIALTTSVIQRGKSGVGRYVLALTEALLAQAGEHRLTLFVLEEDLPLFDFAKDAATLVPVAETWRPAVKNIAWHHAVLPSLLRQHRIDVLHTPSYRRMTVHGAPAHVATIHDLAPFHVRGKYDLARMFYGRVVVRALARRQTEIIAVSHNTAQDIERFFQVPVAQQTVVLNGLDHRQFQPTEPDSNVRSRHGLDQPFFLYVSRLEHPAKNHVRLIEAFHQFKASTPSPWQLVLGGSDWHGAEHIHAAAQASAFAKDIRFLGFVADSELPSLYRAAGAMVYPSLFEGFGLPPVEAMACGCPVISSTRGALQEVVADAADIVDPDNAADIAAALSRLATDDGHRQRLMERGLHNAQRFDWNRNARQVLETYERAYRRTRPERHQACAARTWQEA